MPRPRKLLLFCCVLLVVAGFVLLLVKPGGAPPSPPLPNPNGYDDFLKAAALLTGDVANYRTLEPEELRTLVSSNSESLRLVSLGLSRQCSVPTDAVITNFNGTIPDLSELKSLARLLAADEQLAELQNRRGEAAQKCVNAVRFGNGISRGGMLIHRLVGIACETMGLRPLVKLVPSLTCNEARPLVLELEAMDRDRVTWEEIRQNESRYARHQPIGPINRVALWWVGRASIRKGKERHEGMVAQVRLLYTELALRCYQSDERRPPERLEQLVPKYLRRIPLDPFSNRPLVYRPNGTNWFLYSVGPDRIDDHGAPLIPSGPGTTEKGDLFYNSR